MSLIPDSIRLILLERGRHKEFDHVPLLHLYDLASAASWLITELQPYDEDSLFGLCDEGLGSPLMGTVSLSALESIGSIRRDCLFQARHTLSVYYEVARARKAITTVPSLLDPVAARLKAAQQGKPT